MAHWALVLKTNNLRSSSLRASLLNYNWAAKWWLTIYRFSVLVSGHLRYLGSALLRIMNGIGHKKLEKRTGRRPSPKEQIPPAQVGTRTREEVRKKANDILNWCQIRGKKKYFQVFWIVPRLDGGRPQLGRKSDRSNRRQMAAKSKKMKTSLRQNVFLGPGTDSMNFG